MRVLFSGEVEVPDGTPEEDIEAWLKFEMGETSQLDGKNAMNHTDLMSAGCRNVWIDRTWPSNMGLTYRRRGCGGKNNGVIDWRSK